ncbi:MAG: epimerase, partial [Deltaproteobacteria bacterium]|nr:epimerase [Deltaproteobacteria bacterium]
VPLLLGFDPLFQLMHEEDVISSIVLTIEKRIRGIYNVAGPPPIPLSLVAKLAGRRILPLPEMLLKPMLGRGGLPRLPVGALSHIKYPIVIDSGLFKKATGFQHEFDETATLQAFAQAFPVEG